jgi:hypothetical protein
MGRLKRLRNKVKSATKKVTSTVKSTASNARNVIKSSAQNVNNQLQSRKDDIQDNLTDKLDSARDRLEDRVSDVLDRAPGLLDNLRGGFGNFRDEFQGGLNNLNPRSIIDKLKSNMERDLPPQYEIIKPDFSEVLNEIESETIQKIINKLKVPVSAEKIADTLSTALLEDLDDLIVDEGNELYRERGDESGTFSDVIDIIDEGLNRELLRDDQLPNSTPEYDPEADIILDPNDARHQLIQPNEQNNLYTPGKELTLPSGELYTGDWHTDNINGKMTAFTGGIYYKGRKELTLLPKSDELLMWEQVDLSTNPLDIDTTTEPVTEHDGNDGSISLEIKGGVKPYTIEWTKTVDDEEKDLPNFQGKSSLVDIKAGTYTAYISDSSTKDEEVDLREDLDTQPDPNSFEKLVNVILSKETKFNMNTNGWEFNVVGLPYVGKYHIVEVPADLVIEEQDNPLPMDSRQRRELMRNSGVVREQIEEAVDGLYDKIIGGSSKLGEFFKPDGDFTTKAPPIFPVSVPRKNDPPNVIKNKIRENIEFIKDKREERKEAFNSIKGKLGGFGRKVKDEVESGTDSFNRKKSTNNRRGGIFGGLFGR